VQAASEQHAIDLPPLDSSLADTCSAVLPSSNARRYFERSADPTQLIADHSMTYLKTARLRL
jgi:hypothetical protein